MSGSSYRTILRSSSIIGGASVINIIAGLAKMKAAAVLLGPAGVGLVGLYMNMIQTAATVASLGVTNVGTRQIAAAHAEGSDTSISRTRQALFWGSLVMAVTGGVLFWMASSWIANILIVDDTHSNDVAWLSLGITLTVAAGSQAALLTGMRRVSELARISVGAGVIGATLGVLAIWFWGWQGLVPMVLIAPLVTFVLGHFYVVRLGPPPGRLATLHELTKEWGVMARLGVAFMVSGLITLLGHLAVRTLVQRELGPEALGQFQAASAIGMTYLGFVLTAMGTDYYPRLTAAIRDHATAVRLVNEQTEVALLLCGPLLLVILGFAPLVIRVLYSADFGPAVEVLRWHLLGDILKILSFPLGFVLLALGAGKTFVVAESLGMGAFVGGVFFGLPLVGINAAGFAFLMLYVTYLPIVWWLARRRIGLRWSTAVIIQVSSLMVAAIIVYVLTWYSATLSGAVSMIMALIFGLHGFMQLSLRSELGGRIGQFASRLRALTRR